MRIFIVFPVRSLLAFLALFFLVFAQKMQAQCPATGTMLKSPIPPFALNSACSAPIIRPNDLLNIAQTPACEGQFSLTFSVGGQAVSQPLPGTLAGQPITFALIHPSGWLQVGTIKLADQTKPTIAVNHAFLVCGMPTGTSMLPMPTVSDNCTEQKFLQDSLRHIDQDSLLMPSGCASAFSRIIKRTWRTRDRAGNWGQFVQFIRIKRLMPGDIFFPPDTVHLEACNQNINNLALTGRPLAVGVWPAGLACSVSESKTDHFLGSTCGPGSAWERVWTVSKNDSCGFWQRQKTQIIFLDDPTAPILQCLPDFSVATDAGFCYATFQVPTLTAIDACTAAGATKIGLVSPAALTMGETIQRMPGEYLFRFYATDCSGDSSFCDLKITVAETQSPVLVCTGKPTISLNGHAKATVPMSALVKLVQDNCPGQVVLKVKRADETAFKNVLTVTCADVDKKVAYTVSATDLFGNSTTCDDTISVRDKLGPIFSACPADKTVNCLDPNIYNLDAFGKAVAFDSCGLLFVDYDEKSDLTACGFGSITRTWTAWDVHGNSSVCDQTITVQAPASTKFTAANIKWPVDFVSYGCGSGPNLEPSSLPSGADKPAFSGQFCGNPFSSFHDVIYNSAAPACFKIVRKWTVVDWCVPVPTIGAGKWEYFQTVSVMDTVRPVLTLPANVTASLGADCSSAPVNNLMASATDCSTVLTWRQLVNNAPNPYATNPNSPDLSGNYPSGTTVVKVLVRDGCGLETAGTVKITAADLKKPTPICINGLAINLTIMATDGPPMAMIGKELFHLYSSDNCTPASQLVLKVKKWKMGDPITPATEDQLTYNCSEQGTNLVQLWATDAAGNSDYCTTYILVQPNMADCPPTQVPLIGQIATDDGQKVEHVRVDLPNLSTSTAAMTDQNGAFSIPNLPVGAAFDVRPKRNDDPVNGLSTYDLVLLSKHILGAQSLSSPYRIIAADVNRSNSVSTLDIVEMRKLILGLTSALPNNEAWRFVDASYQFPDPTNPFSTVFPEIKQIGQLSPNAAANFVGIKIGDLNGSAAANGNVLAADDRGRDDELAFFTTDFSFEKGATINVPLRVEAFEKMLGLQTTFEFDAKKLRLADVHFSKKLPRLGLENLGYARAADGLVALSWDAAEGADLADGEPMLELVFECAEKGRLAESLTFSDRLLRSESYEKDAFGGGDKRRKPTLAFLKNEVETAAPKALETAGLRVEQNRPNPFSDATEIGFELPQLVENERVTLRIFDVSGRQIFDESQFSAGGKGQFRVEKIDLPMGARGAFFYRIETSKWAETRRMILQ